MSNTSNISIRWAAEARNAWVSRARCRSTDPDELFVTGAAQRKAAVICRHCPVMVECAAEALDKRIEFGVWGGMTERQRRQLLRKHPDVESWAEFFSARREHEAPANRHRISADQSHRLPAAPESEVCETEKAAVDTPRLVLADIG